MRIRIPAAVCAAICALSISGCATQLPDRDQSNSVDSKYAATAEKFNRQIEIANAELAEKGLILRDSQLAPYIENLGLRLAPKESVEGIQLSFRVLRDPSPNAMALDSGDIYVNLGLIALAENEAQLASILAHEQAHVMKRHGLENWITVTNTVRGAHIADLFLMGTGLGYLAAMAELASYSRGQEKEADIGGTQYLREAGYAVAESAEIFRLLNDLPAKQSGSRVYSSHPDNEERIRYLEKEAQTEQFSDARIDSPGFSSIRQAALERSMALMLSDHSYEMARHFLDLGESRGLSGQAVNLFRADILRRQAKYPRMVAKDVANSKGKIAGKKDYEIAEYQVEEKRIQAVALYQKVIGECADCASAFRGMGLAMYDDNNQPEAKKHLQRYLQLNPDASDRKYIERLIDKN